jgi:hypothetical protein
VAYWPFKHKPQLTERGITFFVPDRSISEDEDEEEDDDA